MVTRDLIKEKTLLEVRKAAWVTRESTRSCAGFSASCSCYYHFLPRILLATKLLLHGVWWQQLAQAAVAEVENLPHLETDSRCQWVLD